MIPLLWEPEAPRPAGKHAPSRFRLAVELVRDPSRQVFSKCIQNLPGIARTDRARFEPAIGVQGTRPRSFVKDTRANIGIRQSNSDPHAKGRASHDKGRHAARRRHRHPASGHGVGLRRAVPGLDRSRSGQADAVIAKRAGQGPWRPESPGCDAQLSADAAIGRGRRRRRQRVTHPARPSMRSTGLARPIAPAILRVCNAELKKAGRMLGSP